MNLPETRIYVELVPTVSSRRVLSDLCDAIAPHIKARPVDPSKWHVTILHFGIAEHVYYDLQREIPHLSRSTFETALTAYIERAKASLPGPTKLLPTELELFGVKDNVLVLRLEPNDIVIKAYHQALTDLQIFLTDCGITDTEAFMNSSINFKWALELKPHITLYRGAIRYQPVDIPLPTEPLSFQSADIHGL